jgi:hypothetical protein
MKRLLYNIHAKTRLVVIESNIKYLYFVRLDMRENSHGFTENRNPIPRKMEKRRYRGRWL